MSFPAPNQAAPRIGVRGPVVVPLATMAVGHSDALEAALLMSCAIRTNDLFLATIAISLMATPIEAPL